MIILICGQPRAGKTTYSKNFTCKVIHLDECHRYTIVNEKVKEVGFNDVVVEGVYKRPIDRQKLLEAYKGNKSRCIWIDTPLEIRSQRENFFSWSNVRFKPPTYDEGWDEIVRITPQETIILKS